MIARSPLVRLLGLLVAGAAAGVAYFAFVRDKVDPSADPLNARDKSLYKRANFTRALGAVRAREGGGAPMLKVQVLPAQAEFQVAAGQRARGYRYHAESGDTEPVKVPIVGPGATEDEQFSLRRVPVDVTERLARAVRRHPGLRATTMTLERGTALKWTITAEGNGRTGLVFTANADGSGFRRA